MGAATLADARGQARSKPVLARVFAGPASPDRRRGGGAAWKRGGRTSVGAKGLRYRLKASASGLHSTRLRLLL